jgi:hypothetical protein
MTTRQSHCRGGRRARSQRWPPKPALMGAYMGQECWTSAATTPWNLGAKIVSVPLEWGLAKERVCALESSASTHHTLGMKTPTGLRPSLKFVMLSPQFLLTLFVTCSENHDVHEVPRIFGTENQHTRESGGRRWTLQIRVLRCRHLQKPSGALRSPPKRAATFTKPRKILTVVMARPSADSGSLRIR